MRRNIKTFNEAISSLLRFCFKEMFSIKALIFSEIFRGFASFILFILKLSRRRALKRLLEDLLHLFYLF